MAKPAPTTLFQLDIHCDVYEKVMNHFYPTLSGLIYDVQITRVDVADNHSMNNIGSVDNRLSWKIPEKKKLLWYGTTSSQLARILGGGILPNFNDKIVLTDKICGAIHYILKRKHKQKGGELKKHPHVFLLCDVNVGKVDDRVNAGVISFSRPGWRYNTRRVKGKPWWQFFPGNVEDAELCDHFIIRDKGMAEIKFVVYADLFVLE